jgi:hypothetical protein
MESYPWFRWDSPGFKKDVQINYRLKVYLFDPVYHSTYLDAIEDDIYLYFDTGWDKEIHTETGVKQQISVQYPSDDRDLACGYQYVWLVEARDYIPDEETWGSVDGVWGWPEPISSPIYVFNYGSKLAAENIISPSVGSVVNTVRPSFSFDQVSCAESYEIWLGYSDDTDVENPFWNSSAIQSTNIQYPFDETGLMPGREYRWKIRVNPDGEPGPWSEIFTFSIESYSLSEPSSGEELSTVNPAFNISGPTDLSAFELRVSNEEDPGVEMGNIYSDVITSLPYEFPSDVPEGLLPGRSYFWKIIFLDGNEDIVGEIDEYTQVSNFTIAPVTLNSPSSGSADLSLTPTFMWDSPLGIPSFEFALSDEDDPAVEDPKFTTVISGTYFQYPQYDDYPLEYGMSYNWKITPLDNNENRGAPSDFFSFSTAFNATATASAEITSEKPEFSLGNGGENAPKDIIVSILAEVAGADENLIYLAYDQEMEAIISEITTVSGETEAVFSGEELEWGETYYVQIFALLEGDFFGEPSSIQSILTPSKPGSDDQVGINVLLGEGSTNPSIEVSNPVTHAIDYIMDISTEADMSDIFHSMPVFEGTPVTYSDSSPILSYGETYFIQITAMDDEGVHGRPSSIFSLFIPNITPPSLKDELFSWDASVPAAKLYKLEVSTTDDFSSIVFEGESEGTTITYAEDNFEPGTMYYWRIVPYDTDGNIFGNVSNVKFFETAGEQVQVEEVEGGVIVSLQLPPSGEAVTTSKPSFSWEAVEGADKYEIKVGAGEDFSQIMWQSPNISQNSVTYPETGTEPLQADQAYFWTVRAISNDAAMGEFSPPFTFSISASNTPILTGPISGTSESVLPYFTWDKIKDAKSYGLILGSNDDLSQLIFESTDITENQFQYTAEAPPLDYDTQLYWKIIAYDEGGSPMGDYSAIAGFKTPSGVVEIEFIYEGDD